MEELIDADDPQGRGRAEWRGTTPSREAIAASRRRRLEGMRRIRLDMFPYPTSPLEADALLAEAEHVDA